MKNKTFKILLINQDLRFNILFRETIDSVNPSIILNVELEEYGKSLLEMDFDLYFVNIDEFSFQILEAIHNVKAKAKIIAITSQSDLKMEGKARAIGITYLMMLPLIKEELVGILLDTAMGPELIQHSINANNFSGVGSSL